MKNLLPGLIWTTAIAAVCLLHMPPAQAHPLGNFTINHYAGLQVAADGIGVDYVLDMAEIPAFQEIHRLDANHNHQPDSTETAEYPGRKCDDILPQLNLQVNQHSVPLALNQAAVEFLPGVGGLATLRLTCQFQGAFQKAMVLGAADQAVEFTDNAYAQRLGWREMTVNAQDIPIQGDFVTTSISSRLIEYPTELLSSPLNQRQVSFYLNPSQALSAPLPDVSPPTPNRFSQVLLGRNKDAFTSLITPEHPSFSTLLVALAIAFVWGGLHALSPGHGKTVVGAYLVGARSRAQDALFLGLTVTLTHTASIFALGLLTLGTSQFILTEQIFPWMSVLSGFLVTAIGLNLLIRRWRDAQTSQNLALTPAIALPVQTTLLALAPSHGQVHPVPTHSHTDHALVEAHARSHARHAHSHAHDDSHGHIHGHAHEHAHEHAHGHDHEHNPGHIHAHHHEHAHHSGKAHSHLPPGADGTPVTWSSILALGVSGGLLPCPSALVVLLSAIAVGQVGFGLALVSAFSLGLAGALTGIGLILVYAKQWFERLPLEVPKVRIFPVVSAALITLIGIGITTQALLVPTL